MFEVGHVFVLFLKAACVWWSQRRHFGFDWHMVVQKNGRKVFERELRLWSPHCLDPVLLRTAKANLASSVSWSIHEAQPRQEDSWNDIFLLSSLKRGC